jgi:hypothetical protein
MNKLTETVVVKQFPTVVVELVVIVLLIIGIPVSQQAVCQPLRQFQTLSDEEIKDWESDLDAYLHKLESGHANLYHSISREKFVNEINKLKSRLRELNRNNVILELTRITNLIDDGHTKLIWPNDEFLLYPFEFMAVDSKYRVARTSEQYKDLTGSELVAINGFNIEELFDLLGPYAGGVDNEQSLNNSIRTMLVVPEILMGVGICPGIHDVIYTFKDSNGKTLKIKPKPHTPNEYRESLTVELENKPKPPGEIVASTDGIWLSIEEADSIGYIQFYSYPHYSKVEEFSSLVRENLFQSQIKYLIIDFRNNVGGNSFVGLTLLRHLLQTDSIYWDNGVYILIAEKTFSAGVVNAVQFQQLLNAKLIGVPTGGSPNGYQDADSFELPNSSIKIAYSKRYFKLQENSNSSLRPDIYVTLDWEKYRRGVDSQIEWIQNDIKHTAERSR